MILDHVRPVDIYRELKAFYGKDFLQLLESRDYEDLEREYATGQEYVESEGYWYTEGDVELDALLSCGPEVDHD